MAVQIVNFLLYQIGWFVLVVGAANDLAWAATCVALALTGIHLTLVRNRSASVALCLIAAAIGFVVELLLKWSGTYRLAADPNRILPPFWIIVVWGQFATLLPYCLRWMSGKYVLTAVFGFFGGPLAFLAGERINGVTFLAPREAHLLVLAVLWSAAAPMLVFCSDMLFGSSTQREFYRNPFQATR